MCIYPVNMINNARYNVNLKVPGDNRNVVVHQFLNTVAFDKKLLNEKLERN